MTTFIDKCIAGSASPSEIDDYVDVWHESDSGLELHEFLGMTLEEYYDWMLNPARLRAIISAHKSDRVSQDSVREDGPRYGH